MHPNLNIAIRAAKDAGDFIVREMDRVMDLKITEKNKNDFVTEIDTQAENIIIETIKHFQPNHAFLCEESGKSGDSNFVWIIDPLDGTTNFLSGIPHFAVSIALENKGVIEQAVIYDPIKHELFTASKGDGAQLNNKKIRVNKKKELQGALLGTGFPFGNSTYVDKFTNSFQLLYPHISGIRRFGAASLDLAYVACGRLDGFWEFNLKPWDIAAGTLLIKEAGGISCGIEGEIDLMKNGNIVSANTYLLKKMLKIIN